MEEHTGQSISPDQAADPDPDKVEEVVAAIEHDLKAAEWLLAPMQRQWFEQTYWYAGEHYLEYNDRTRRFQNRPAKRHIRRSITNYILPHVETGVSLLMDALPSPKVVPETKEDADRIAAEIGQSALRYRDEVGCIDQKKREACVICVTTGTVYLQAELDLAHRETVKIPLMERSLEPVIGSDGVPVIGPDGAPVLVEKEIPLRNQETNQPEYEEAILVDEGVNVLTPFEIVPDFAARYPWEARKYLHFRPQTRDWIGQVFGSAARKRVKPETAYGTLVYHQIKMMDLLVRSAQLGRAGFPSLTSGGVTDWRMMEDMAVVKARYTLPNDRRPKGRMIVVANGQVLHDGEYPYGERLNLFTLRWSVVPGSIWGMGMVRNLILPQKRLNGIDTQIDLIRKTMGNPQWLAPKGIGFDGDSGTSEPGHQYTFRHRSGYPPPQRLPPVNSPQDAIQQREQIVQDMEQISGMMNVLRGDRPPGIEAGVAIDALTEQAAKRFNPVLIEMRAEMKRLYMKRLEIMQDSTAWQNPRPVPMLGEDGRYDLRYFSAADFKGNLTITIEAVPMISLSQALKKQNFMVAVNLGLIDIQTNVRNREKARALLGSSEFDEQFTLDYKRAKMENEMILAGKEPTVGVFDNNDVHLQVLMEIIKDRNFDNYPEKVRRIALLHASRHLEAIEREALTTTPEPEQADNNGAGKMPQPAVNTPGVADIPAAPANPPNPGV